MADRAFLSRREERGLKWVSVALISLVAFETLAVATAMPTVVRALDGANLYALAMGIPMAIQLVATAVAGPWSDHHSPQSCLYAGVVLFVAGLTVCTFAPSMYVFTLGRAIQGFGGGLSIVPLYALIGHHVHPKAQPSFFAAFAAAWVLPAMIGPAVAGLVVEHASWRWIFGFVPAIALLTSPILIRVVGSLPKTQPTPPSESIKRKVLLAAGAGVCVAVLQVLSGGEPDSFSPLVLTVIGGTAVLTFIFVRPLLPAGTLGARRGLASTVLLRGTANGAFVGVEVFLPLLLQVVHGWTPVAAGLVLTTGSLTWAAGSAISSRITDPGMRGRIALFGVATQLAGTTVTFAGVFAGVSGIVVIGGWALTGLGIGLIYPTMTVHGLAMTPVESKGKTSSSLQIADTLGAAFCVAVAGIGYALAMPNVTASFASVIGLMIVVLLVALPVSRRIRPLPGSAEETELAANEAL